jgi:hypothetical protein
MKRLIQTSEARKRDVFMFLKGAGFEDPYLWDSTGILMNDEDENIHKHKQAFEDFSSKIDIYPGSTAKLIAEVGDRPVSELHTKLNFGDILRFAQRALIEADDSHHVFLEAYKMDYSTWHKPENVIHLTFGS